MLWVALLAFGNVRERRAEIGVLRALGVRSLQILAVFLGRAVLMGIAGACLGLAAGFLVGSLWREGATSAQGVSVRLDAPLLLAVLIGAPVVAALAGWLPSYLAAQQDPAEVLSQE